MAVIPDKFVAIISDKYMANISGKYVVVVSYKFVAVISDKYVAVISASMGRLYQMEEDPYFCLGKVTKDEKMTKD